jgi:hypothetical protein
MYLASVAVMPGAHKPDTSWWFTNVVKRTLLSPVRTFTTPAGKSDESITYTRRQNIYNCIVCIEINMMHCSRSSEEEAGSSVLCVCVPAENKHMIF